MDPLIDDVGIRRLVAAAESAFAGGLQDEGTAMLSRATLTAPDHPLVLNAVAVRALSMGNPAAARDALQRALERAPDKPVLWLNLASACRALGDAAGEMAALDQALALEPRYFLALLQKGSLLERNGHTRRAAAMYQIALQCMPRDGGLPASLLPAVERAREAVRRESAALESFLRARLSAVRARHAGARQDRVDECLDVLLGRKRIYVQQPTFMHFPRLPAIPFHDREAFPWLATLERASAAIRKEAMHRLAEQSGIEPYVARPEGVPLDQWKDLNRSRRWGAFHLWRLGTLIDGHAAQCPATMAALAQVPLLRLRDQAPTAFFSILEPRTRIPPHTGGTNVRLIVHLPLIVPEACRFRVGADVREWRAGEAWVFDDTIEHEAWNDSDSERVVLIFDIWNPLLTAAERDLIRATLEAIHGYYGGASALDGL